VGEPVTDGADSAEEQAAPARPDRALRTTLGANGTLALLAVATGLLAAHILGPGGEGQLAAIQTWPLLLADAAMLGLPAALTFAVARRPEQAKQYVATAVVMALLSLLVVGAAAWFLLPILLAAQTPGVVAAARVFLLIGVVYAVVGIPHGSLRGAGRFGAWNLYRVAPGMAWLGILIGAAVAGGLGAVELSRWFLVGLAVTGLPFLLVVRRRLQGSARPQLALAPGLLRFGLPSVLTTVPQTLNLRLDQLLIIALLPPHDLGYYVVAVAWSGASAPVLSAVGAVLFPRVAMQSEEGRRAEMLGIALQGGLVVAALLGAGLAALALPLLPLVYGERFAPSVPSALVLAPAGAVLAWAAIAESGLRGLGRPSAVLVAEGVGAAVTLAALPVLLSTDGILGAAIASLLGYSAVAAVAVLAIARSTDQRLRALVMPTWPTTKGLAVRSASLLRLRRNGADS